MRFHWFGTLYLYWLLYFLKSEALEIKTERVCAEDCSGTEIIEHLIIFYTSPSVQAFPLSYKKY